MGGRLGRGKLRPSRALRSRRLGAYSPAMSALSRSLGRLGPWLAAAALLHACGAEPAPPRVVAGPPAPARAESVDGSISIVLEGDLLVHRFSDAVAATTADAMLRVYVQRQPPEKLIRIAGSAKDSFAAHGWEVTEEQHFELAIRVVLDRGGATKSAAERRDVWWVERPEGVFMCDAVARPAAYDALGEAHKTRCLSVILAPVAGEEDSSEDSSGGSTAAGDAEASGAPPAPSPDAGP